MDAKLYYFPSPAVNKNVTPDTVSLNGVEQLPTEESMLAVSVALENLNRRLDHAIAVGEDSLRRIARMKQRAQTKIMLHRERVKRTIPLNRNPA